MNIPMIEVLSLVSEALSEERLIISNKLYEMQLTVSQCASSKECIAYNRALRDAAELITKKQSDNEYR